MNVIEKNNLISVVFESEMMDLKEEKKNSSWTAKFFGMCHRTGATTIYIEKKINYLFKGIRLLYGYWKKKEV